MLSTRSLLVLTTCLFTFSAELRATPADRTVAYRIYADPANPQGGLLFTVALRLSASTTSGSAVAWEVEEADIVQYASGGNPSRKWSEPSPTVSTADGLWWVTHADPENPLLSEFTMPPSISGVAGAEDPQEPDLEYSIVGRVYVPPPTGAHFLITAALDYVFTEVGSAEPEEEDDDEPAEVGDFGDAERFVVNTGPQWE